MKNENFAPLILCLLFGYVHAQDENEYVQVRSMSDHKKILAVRRSGISVFDPNDTQEPTSSFGLQNHQVTRSDCNKDTGLVLIGHYPKDSENDKTYPIVLYDLKSKDAQFFQPKSPISSVKWKNENHFIVGTLEKIMLYDIRSEKKPVVIYDNYASMLKYNTDSTYCAFLDKDKKLAVYDEHDKKISSIHAQPDVICWGNKTNRLAYGDTNGFYITPKFGDATLENIVGGGSYGGQKTNLNITFHTAVFNDDDTYLTALGQTENHDKTMLFVVDCANRKCLYYRIADTKENKRGSLVWITNDIFVYQADDITARIGDTRWYDTKNFVDIEDVKTFDVWSYLDKKLDIAAINEKNRVEMKKANVYPGWLKLNYFLKYDED